MAATREHPGERGRNAAMSRIDSDGCGSARRWFLERMRRKKGREALDPRYVTAYRDVLVKACPTRLRRR